MNPSVVDEDEGLPSPPLDEIAFFATPAGSMELSRVTALPLFYNVLVETMILVS